MVLVPPRPPDPDPALPPSLSSPPPCAGQIEPPSQNKQRLNETSYDISNKTETNRAPRRCVGHIDNSTDMGTFSSDGQFRQTNIGDSCYYTKVPPFKTGASSYKSNKEGNILLSMRHQNYCCVVAEKNSPAACLDIIRNINTTINNTFRHYTYL